MTTDREREVLAAADWLESVWKAGTRKAVVEAEHALAVAVQAMRTERSRVKPAAE